MKKSIFTPICLLLCLMLLFAGCGTSTDSTAADGGGAAASDYEHPVKDPFLTDDVKIAFVANRASDTVASAWAVGLQRVADYYSHVTLQVFDGEGSAETQISIMADIIEQQFDCMVIQCVDSAAEDNAVQEVIDAGIPVISLNIAPTINHACKIRSGGYAFGYEAGLLAAEKAGANAKAVVILRPAASAVATEDNPVIGFTDALKENGISILEEQAGDWTTEKANEITRDYLTKYNDVDIVMCANDAMAAGAALAIQSAGRENIQVWGSDGESKALEYIEQGLMTGTIYTNFYEMGEFACQLSIYAITNSIDLNKQSSYITYRYPAIVVTADNVAQITERW